jgi:peptidyl-prolyl cis-trans isomerase B (cyclophilin B)
MKHLFSLPLLSIALSTLLHAQARPHYAIHVSRADTNLGTIEVELFPDIAPLTVRNFDSLVGIGFYDGTAFHRVVPNFVIQGGDPNSRDQPEDTWGYGDPSQTTVPAEFSPTPHVRGSLSMARRGDDINSSTSQFFICVKDQPSLNGKYNLFGRVVKGMDVVDTIVRAPRNASDRPLEKISMEIVSLGELSAPAEALEAGALSAVRPNPCAATATIEYRVPERGHVRLDLHDVTGRLVGRPVDEEQGSGLHAAACDMTGLPPGVYTYTLAVGGRLVVGRFVKGS